MDEDQVEQSSQVDRDYTANTRLTPSDSAVLEVSSGGQNNRRSPCSNGSGLAGRSGILKGRSDVWKHFDMLEENDLRFAVCKICKRRLKQPRTAGTGTLRNHIASHMKESGRGVGGARQVSIESFKTNSGPSSPAYARLNLPNTQQRQKLVNWMVRRNISFAEVEDPSFREFIFSLNDGVKLMSRTCVREDIWKMYDQTKPILMKRLSNLPGGVCVSVDGWTSECQRKTYVGVVLSFIEKWEQKSVLLSLRHAESESHTGEVIANLLYDELKAFNIHSKLFAMASDNGSNMVSAWPILVELCAKDGIVVDNHMHARCVCHVINIAVRTFMKEIGADRSLGVADFADVEQISEDSLHAHAVNHVRFLTSYVHSSPKRLSRFKSQQCYTGATYEERTAKFKYQTRHTTENPRESDENVQKSYESDQGPLLPKTETVTRWNSTYIMLKRALEIRSALSMVCVGESSDKNMIPDEHIWSRIETVLSFLEIFYDLTLVLQKEESFIGVAVPAYNELFDHLDDWLGRVDDKLVGTTSVERGTWIYAIESCKDVLSKYYSKTDSRLYSCATYCDPRMRASYWSEAKYEKKWIAKARSQIREVYSSTYKLHSQAVDQMSSGEDEGRDPVQRAMWKRAKSTSDELSLYEQGYVANLKKCKALSWWKMHAAEFPGIARMSLDMLAVPASTAGVERVFSKAKLMLPDSKSVLDPEIAGKMASLSSWFFDLGIGI